MDADPRLVASLRTLGRAVAQTAQALAALAEVESELGAR